MTRWKITIEYKGTNFCGWQIQNDVPTIQGALQDALHKFCQQTITVQGSGRTDAGVHAWAQIAHFDLDYPKPLDAHTLMSALNAHLRPHPIHVLHAEEIDEGFHARFSAKEKTYHYRMINRAVPLTIDRGLAWHVKQPLDAAAMHEAAQILVGQHDFTTFRDSECQSKSPIKTVDSLSVTASAYDNFGGQDILIEAKALSFLHHQIRNFAGSLKLVGQGKWDKHDLKHALEAKSRSQGGPTAPAEGLYLKYVIYR